MLLRVFVTTFRTFPWKHWALNFQHETQEKPFKCFQIGGAAKNFAYQTLMVRNPENTRRWAESIELGQAEEQNLADLRKIAETLEIDNDDKEWHCQRWTLALVKKLRDEGIIQPKEKSMLRLEQVYERYPSVWDWMCLGYDYNRFLALSAYEQVYDAFTGKREENTEAEVEK